MNEKTIHHIFPDHISIDQNGRLKIDGHDLTEMAAKCGTPLYIYDGNTIKNNVAFLRKTLDETFPGDYEISYAAKAYLSTPFAKKINRLKLTLDAVSLGEMMTAKKGGFPAKRVHLHGNNKSEKELRFALSWGVDNIVVDSLEELAFLENIARNMRKTARIWLRLTPDVNVNTHPHVQTSHHASKFGIPVEDGQAEQALKFASESKALKLTGLHMHIGSQIFEIDPFLEALGILYDTARKMNIPLMQISPGGGWGVPYTLEQEEFDVPGLISQIAALLVAESFRLDWPLPKLIVEPGRWLVARSGVALYSIGTTKRSSDGTYFVSVDGGMSDNPRPAMYGSKYTACIADRTVAETNLPSKIVGKFCESGDQLITDVLLPEVKRGDILALPVSGAYQLSMASNYNLTPRPAVIWLEDGKIEMLQPREKLEQVGWWQGKET